MFLCSSDYRIKGLNLEASYTQKFLSTFIWLYFWDPHNNWQGKENPFLSWKPHINYCKGAQIAVAGYLGD
jgi:hypothetical protein